MSYHFRFGLEVKGDLNSALPFWTDIKTKLEHTYILGLTGTGKSTLLENMINYDIQKGYSVILIDPKGFLANSVYNVNKDNDKVKFCSFDNPINLNPLNLKDKVKKEELISFFVDYIDAVVSLTSSNQETTVRMQEIIKHTLGAFKEEFFTLPFFIKFLLKEKFRQKVIKNQGLYFDNDKLNDIDFISSFLVNPGSKFSKVRQSFEETMTSISSRLDKMVNYDNLKGFFESDLKLDIDEFLENGQSLIFNASTSSDKDLILIANLIIFHITAYIRNGIPKKKHLFVYVDEFHYCASSLFRAGYDFGRHNLVGYSVAHHDFAEMDLIGSTKFGDYFLTKSHNYCVFQCGTREAKTMENVLDIDFKRFLTLPKHHFYLKTDNKFALVQGLNPKSWKIDNPTDYPNIAPPKPVDKVANSYLNDEWITYS